ncbi:choice-of-anchor L domain-containing protein [Flavobacterium tructae]|uniref:PKD/Chitinase domain-containing protein n=1 Tax=Flavobacterium tructae TaxID=1114873 RepID=A0A1S1J0F0_9FLAO|nr:choice-of-anchor L domain-containing protein [Flavobacterium tructae]OHT43171.1 hypothetical protein BHE19_19565 [Flavobacterium tructae]
MKTKTTLQEVGNFIKCGTYFFPFHKNVQQDTFSKISLKSFLILILGLAMYSSAVVAQEIPVRYGNTLPYSKATSKTAKTAASTEAVSALAAVAGSIDVANPSTGYNAYSADQLVRNILTSGCLTISNVRFGYYRNNNNNWTWVDHTWSATAGDRQLGYFSKGTSTFPIDEGLLLSTGKISSAMGPNTYTNKSDAMVSAASDQDLTAISGETMHDASILEFNFIPDGNLVEFKFVFASEEYLEYVNTDFNDAFGFFLSGFGITGTYTNNAINLAQLPNGDAVTINNIHSAGTNVNNVAFPAKNATYYSNNPPGSTTMEYDGSTVVLTATYAVTAGKTYKIKMAIADASDQQWDAGVFLKAKSFATNTLVITNPAPVCVNGTADLTLPAVTAGSTSGLTYTYWQDAAATIPYNTPTAAPVGTYYIKGQNTQSGCSDTKPVVVSQTNIVITETAASHVDVKCKGGATGSATVTASGGSTPYTYSWNTTPVQTSATASNLAAGTYTVTATDSKGCTGTKQIIITEPTAVLTATTSQTNAACNAGTTGSATVTPAGGTAPYTYSWNTTPVQTSATASNLAAGTYTVTIKDANLCTITKTFTITEPTAITATTSQTNVLCKSGTTGSATVTPTGGTGAYTYSWSPSGGSAATASNLAAGTYTVTIKDANLCTITKTFTITEPAAALTATTSQTNVLCKSDATGSATVTPAGGTGAYTYSWSPSGGSSATASNLAAGTYTVTIKDANLCTITKTFTITEPTAALTATTSQTNVLCKSDTTGSATVTVSGGTGSYTYSWAPSGGSAATASNLAAGTYTVTIKDANLCTITKTFTITEPTAALTATTSQTNVLCKSDATGSATVTVSGGTGAYTYSWAPSGGSAATASNLAAGTYTVTIKDANLCTITKTFTITEPAAALTATTSQTNVLCKSDATGSATVTPTGGTGAYTYSWAPSGGSAATASNLAAGTYTVTIKDANLCTITKTFTITEPAAALTATTSQTNASCNSGATGSATVTVSGGTGAYTYSWAPSGGSAATASNLAAGTYTVTIKDANLCTITKTFTITEPSTITATTSQTNVLCKSDATGSATVTPTGGTGAYTYSWSPSGGSAATATNLAAGTYTVTIKDANLCSITKTFTITEPAAALTATTSQTNVLCKSDTTGSATVTVSGGTGAYTYSWAPSGGSAATASNLAAGTYTVTIKDANLCTITKTFTITEPAAALTATTSQTNVLCKSDTTGSATVTPTGGTGAYTYSWAPSGGSAATASNLAAGTYTVTIKDANLCTITKTVTITEPAAALTATTSQTNASCNSGATGSATVTVSGGTGAYTYSWSPSGGSAATASNLAAGTYTVTIKDANLCTITKTFTITEPSTITATTSQTNVLCKSDATGSATVTPTGGTGAYTYSWSPSGGSAATASNLTAGTYTVTIKDANLCSITKTVTITEPSAPLTATTSQTNVACNAGTTGSATVTVSGGTGAYTYSWAPSGGSAATASNLAAGTYTVTIKDANLCTITKTFTITEPTAITATTSQTNVLCKSNTTGSATVTPTGGTGAYTYSWSPSGGSAATASNLAAGTYTVTIKDANLCTITKTVTIIEPAAALTATTSQTNVSCNAGTNGSATVTVSGGTGVYTYSWAPSGGSAATASNLAAGTYTVTIKDANLCSITKTFTITEPTVLTATTSQMNVGCGGDNTGSATVNVSGGTPAYTYLWSPSGGTAATASALTAGTYTVTVTDANSCTISKSVTIIDGDSIKPIIDPLPQTSTINCPATPVFATATATDNNGVISSLTYKDVITPGGCAGSYTQTRTWTAVDACGNISLPVSQVIIVQDISAPTWSTAAASLNKTIECSDTAALTAAQALFPTATDACDTNVSNIVKVSGAFVASQGCANAGTYTNTWTVKDDCGNTSDIFTQVITIQDTSKPTWSTQTASLNKTIECSDTAALTAAQALFPTATDACDTNVSNIVKVSGAFVASQGCANAGTYTNTWTVKDDCGNTSDIFTQVITIQDTSKPTWSTQTASLNKTIECSDTAALTAAQALFPTATDACDTNVSNIVKVSGAFVASQGCANAGTYTNTWTVKDDCGNTSDIFTQVITIQDTSKPTWSTAAASLNKTIECSDTAALTAAQALFPTATDACDTNVSNIVKVSGAFVASQGCANAGTYTNTWTVKDDCGNTSDTFTQVITIQDTSKPTWSTVAASLNKTIECSDTAALTAAQALFPTATDACDTNVSNIVKVSGAFVASQGCANAGTYTNTWTVKDDCGNTSDTFTQVITIQDTSKPTWSTQTASLNKTVECSDTAALTAAQALFPTATDACDTNVSNIVKVSGAFLASEGCSNAGTYTNTWTVKDDCGNTSDTFTQVITIQDTSKPTFTGVLPADITVSCDAVPQPANMEASDNCSGNLPIVFSETKSNTENQCSTNYTLTRKWTTSDCSGNTISYTQIITVRDTTPPTGTAPVNVANLQTIADIPVGNPSDITNAVDNCSSTVNITVSDANNGGSGCDGSPYILTRTYTLTDCAGNKTLLTQTFTVENKVSVSGVATNVNCSNGRTGSIQVTSSPGSTVIIKNEKNETVGNTNLPAGTYTLTATSSVNKGNQACTATATVTITATPNETTTVSSLACNDDSTIINLLSLLPENTPTNGIWVDNSNTNSIQGNNFNPLGLAIGNYTFEYKIPDASCPRSIVLNMAINDDCKVLACGSIVVHNAFSPNGDGINDVFTIDSIGDTTCYPENDVEIYNRWGVLVFETHNYNNQTNAFDGISRGRTTVKQSDGLPTGTYFYIINYKSLDGNNVLQNNKKDGYLYLSK